MGRAARQRAMAHVMRMRSEMTDCKCSRCRHPPAMRPGDVLDFERAGLVAKHEQATEAARARGRAVLGGLVLALLFIVVAVARCAHGG